MTNALSKTWHADCFKCTNCGKKLVPGSWTSRDVRACLLSISIWIPCATMKVTCVPEGDVCVDLLGRMIRTASGAYSASTIFEHSFPTRCHNTTDYRLVSARWGPQKAPGKGVLLPVWSCVPNNSLVCEGRVQLALHFYRRLAKKANLASSRYAPPQI